MMCNIQCGAVWNIAYETCKTEFAHQELQSWTSVSPDWSSTPSVMLWSSEETGETETLCRTARKSLSTRHGHSWNTHNRITLNILICFMTSQNYKDTGWSSLPSFSNKIFFKNLFFFLNKMTFLFQLLKCEYFLFSLKLHDNKPNVSVFLSLQTFEDVTMGF